MAGSIEEIVKRKLAKAISTLPPVLGNVAVNHSLDSFKSQGWDGSAWRKRLYSKGQGPTILVKSGAGRRSIRILETGPKRVVYGTDVKYMRAHNEGFSGTVNVKSYSRNTYGRSKVYSVNQRTKAGNPRSKTVSFVTGSGNVKAHTRKMNLPRRQFADSGPAHSVILRKRLIQAGKAHILKNIK